MNGTYPVSGTLDELVGPDKVIYQAVRNDEFGAGLDNYDIYWTGTRSSGEAASELCGSWVVAAGDAEGHRGVSGLSALGWTSQSFDYCNSPRHLLCLEPGASETNAPPWLRSALAFVTSAYGTGDLSSWPEAGSASGLAAGDAICRNLAAAAHLPAPASFFAWLSNLSTDAGDRLTLAAGIPVRRVDHYRVALSRTDLLANGNENSLHVDERGAYLTERLSVWTGTDELGNGAGAGTHCNGWTSAVDSAYGLWGSAAQAEDAEWTEGNPVSCDKLARLYCFTNAVTIFWDGFDLSQDLSRWSSSAP